MSFIQTIRKPRILGMSIFDIVTGFLGMVIVFLLAWKWHFPKLSPWRFVGAAVLLMFPVGIAFHIVFGVNTSLNYRLGLSYKP